MQASILIAVGVATTGFGSVVLIFRLQREAQMEAEAEITWIPWADWLSFTSTAIALLFVLAPTLIAGDSVLWSSVARA